MPRFAEDLEVVIRPKGVFHFSSNGRRIQRPGTSRMPLHMQHLARTEDRDPRRLLSILLQALLVQREAQHGGSHRALGGPDGGPSKAAVPEVDERDLHPPLQSLQEVPQALPPGRPDEILVGCLQCCAPSRPQPSQPEEAMVKEKLMTPETALLSQHLVGGFGHTIHVFVTGREVRHHAIGDQLAQPRLKSAIDVVENEVVES
mmetsp:Transcript_87210/g.236331  ORF Transcript_87210/g.236331 Transcript_87210/m.236331 type:complete len:203 (-) Transcript_87210:623-1231(-)